MFKQISLGNTEAKVENFKWTDVKAGTVVEGIFQCTDAFNWEDSVIYSLKAKVDGVNLSINMPAHLKFLVEKAACKEGDLFKIVYKGKQKVKNAAGKSFTAHQFEFFVDDGK